MELQVKQPWLSLSERQGRYTGLEFTECKFTALQRKEWAASFAMDSLDTNGKGMKRKAGGNTNCSLTSTQRPSPAPRVEACPLKKRILSKEACIRTCLTMPPVLPKMDTACKMLPSHSYVLTDSSV